MSALERIWELIGLFFTTIIGGFERGITGLFGSSNARQVRRMQGRVERIAAYEPKLQELTDDELKGKTDEFRSRLSAGETLDDILEEAFAVCREAGRRYLGMRHYDTQMIGGMVLHEGKIAEMVTGEGKTLVATLPAYLNAIEGKGVHVITVNDYLARRDMEWMAPLYMGLGLTVGAIQSGLETLDRQTAYNCDITYGTNNEFGFDYLRDNMRPAARGDERFPKELQQSQRELNFAVIDEVDNILIDEARTPLIISGPAHMNLGKYAEADRVARQLKKETHFVLDEKNRSANLTDEGVREAERLAGVESFYTPGNMEWPHLIDNALKAHHLYKLDVNYVVKEGQVIIVDEFTGRLMEGRQWSDGLHQAVEAKEGVKIKEETQTFATITLQNYFKLYKKLAGMTGTAMTEAGEFWKIYKLEVVAIPTNRKMQRIEHPDAIYLSEKDKFTAVADDIEKVHKWDVVTLKDEEIVGRIQAENDQEITIVPKLTKDVQRVPRDKVVKLQRSGRPILVGTVSIEKSERLSRLLDVRGIPHQVLNAKHHRREAEIVAQAGRLGAVTIATNMAGRGTDIILGGNAETMAWARLQDKYPTRLEVPNSEWDALVEEIETSERMREQGEVVRNLGGLYVIGTERHESRRIDLQLRGRCGRQGDPGSSRFYLSLEDDLMRIFAGDFVKSVMMRLGMKEGEAIESPMVTRRIAAAQKKVEERHFDQRKSLLDYDEVMDEQRKRVYRFRQQILDGFSCRNLILSQINDQIERHGSTFLDPLYGLTAFANWAGPKLGCQLEGRDFKNMDFDTADRYAKDVATRGAESAVFEAIEENLPSGEEESEWNWQALVNWLNTRYGTKFHDRELRQLERSTLEERLVTAAQEAVEKIDLTQAAPLLEEGYGLRMLASWVHSKFGITLDPQEVQHKEANDVLRLLKERAETVYRERESAYPVLAGLSRFSEETANGLRLDRDGLVHWAVGRFEAPMSVEQLASADQQTVANTLLDASRQNTATASLKYKEAASKVEHIYSRADDTTSVLEATGGNGSLDGLSAWLDQELHKPLPKDELATMNREELERALTGAVDEKFHPEMRRMERGVLLSIVDGAWKEHLLVMDHLRSSVGLKGFAQLDPKVEYKREGMRLFEQMWHGIAERTTDLIFRMESLNDDFIKSTWVAPTARHDRAQSTSELAREAAKSENQKVAQSSQRSADTKPEPIRNTEPRVGRNDPCPCGSGKKHKNCCMRN